MGASNGLQGSAVGGMGPPSHHHMQESNPGELKPKLIKRLAQSHEIHSLREKEGNEAKAKRVCMQKVKEHGLNMEILDAEFQMYVSHTFPGPFHSPGFLSLKPLDTNLFFFSFS
jgi:cell fate regulator YaaT (PSP1 superfamily)